MLGDTVLPWPGHPSGAVAAAGAVPAAEGDTRRFQPGGAQLRSGVFGGDARFAKAFVPLVPSSMGDPGMVGVFTPALTPSPPPKIRCSAPS